MDFDASDKELVARCLAGEVNAFEGLVDRYQGVVYNLAVRMVHRRDDAVEVAQSAFVKAYEKLDTFNPAYKFFSWLYRIAVNEALGHLQRRRGHGELDAELPAPEADPGGALFANEQSHALQGGIAALTPDYRTVLVLKHFQDLSYAEIAEIVGIPEKTVKSRLYSARQLLKDILVRDGLIVP